MLKKKKEIPLLIPPENEQINHWLVFGLDPSVSRTGYALMEVIPQAGAIISDSSHSNTPAVPFKSTVARWIAAGSVKPEIEADLHSRSTLWIRSKALALFLREFIKSAIPQSSKGDFDTSRSRTGLIIAMEFPTPQNDFLVALNRILHIIFFEDDELVNAFGEIHILTTNAATMRSLMRLTQRGKNTKEKIERAYEYINRDEYPQIDGDSCDGVLHAMIGRYVAAILLGCSEELPEKFLQSLCDSTQELKGNQKKRLQTKGLLHRIEYWYLYERRECKVGVRDAANPKKTLERITFQI